VVNQTISGLACGKPIRGHVAFLGGLNPIGVLFAGYFIQHITLGGSLIDMHYYNPQIADLISSIIIYTCGFVLFFTNMIANLTGMICDGAKPSCSLKISSGVSTAILSATLSMEGKHVTAAEGIIDEDVDKSIRNLTSIGKEAMCNTDDMVLNIMTHKCN